MTNTYSPVGLTTTGDLTTYDMRSISPGKTADNKAYVSSKTAGKTHRVPGNLDATWAISLYAKDEESEIPATLRAGQVISVQLQHDTQTYTMIIDDSNNEINVETGDLVGISLVCSADSATSYHSTE